MEFNPAFIVCGFVVGAVVGITGMGGGGLMTGSLIAIFGVHPVTAVGTDLVYAAVTKVFGTVAHARNGNVNWRLTLALAAGSVPAAVVSIYLLARFNAHESEINALISRLLGVLLLVAAVALIAQVVNARLTAKRSGIGASHGMRIVSTIGLGVALGALVAVTSVGAGAIGMVVLIALYPRVALSRLIGTDIAHAVPLTIVAGVGHWMIGSVDWSLLWQILAGSLPGIWIGSQFAHRIPERILLSVLAVVLTGLAAKLLLV